MFVEGYLNIDGGMLFIGPEAERRFRHRHFMNLMAVFTAPPEFTALHGRDEIGRIDPSLLADRVEGPRLLLADLDHTRTVLRESVRFEQEVMNSSLFLPLTWFCF